MSITNRALFDALSAATDKKEINGFTDHRCKMYLTKYLRNMFEEASNIEHIIDNFLKSLKKKWQTVHRSRSAFLRNYKDWLDSSILIEQNTPSKGERGRPTVSFEEASQRSKIRKTKDLMSLTPPRLYFATSKLLEREGYKKESKDLKQVSRGNQSVYSPAKALAIMLDCSLSKANYQYLRNEAIENGISLYPTYNDVRKVKMECFPLLSDQWKVTDSSVEISLQELVNHTTKRICEINKNLFDPSFEKISLYGKIGFDGSSGQSIYKQRNTGMDRDLSDEGSVFMSCYVPIQLFALDTRQKRIVLWQNPKTSSTSYCRPVRFSFVKETIDILIKEEDFLMNAINNIQPTNIEIFKVHHTIEMTMIDGKVATALSEQTNSFQCCSICGARPTEMNFLEAVSKKPLSESSLRLGLSTLHAWIRCMECFLHIAYKLPVKKWTTRVPSEKTIILNRKNEIQQSFKNQTGLVIDVPKSSGSGTSNDGNTARRFFQNVDMTSKITGIDLTLLKRIHVILCVLSSEHVINQQKFS